MGFLAQYEAQETREKGPSNRYLWIPVLQKFAPSDRCHFREGHGLKILGIS